MDYAERILKEQLAIEKDDLLWGKSVNNSKFVRAQERRIKSIESALSVVAENTTTSSEQLAAPAVSKSGGLQGRELLLAYEEWRCQNPDKLGYEAEQYVDWYIKASNSC